jgi:hypothetical protein
VLLLSRYHFQMPAEPIGERGLVDPTAGDTFHDLNRIQGVEAYRRSTG